MNANEMYEYVERIANLIRTNVRKSGLASGLQPVQMEALHYLSRCNRYSDTPVAVAEFLGLTKGTVSQTIGVLENNHLVQKVTDKRDRRVVHLHLTPNGESVLAQSIPPKAMTAALQIMTDQCQHQLGRSLQELLSGLQHANGLKTFGPCKTCIHHLYDGAERRCELTRENLTDSDAEKICREHIPSP